MPPLTVVLMIAAQVLLVIGSVLVLYLVVQFDRAQPMPEGFVKEGRRWKR